MPDSLFVFFQHLLPKRLLTQCMGYLASAQGGWLTQRMIRWFIARYGVNMNEAANPQVESYASFNEFFTRPLQPGARPLATATWVCPVDGAISQLGRINKDQIFQAKGHSYSTRALVGGDAALAAQFEGGHFACLYLSPKDYHRIHMPCAAQLQRMVYVPGALYSVNPATARGIAGLFARNERVVCEFHTAHGPLLMVLVGATIVGSMATTWHGVVNPPRTRDVRQWRYTEHDIEFTSGSDAGRLEYGTKFERQFAQGQEMGRFLLGSTVVMLWPPQHLQFNSTWLPGRSIRLGEAMADTAS
jgi:phosphatidylserine decarboxylase